MLRNIESVYPATHFLYKKKENKAGETTLTPNSVTRIAQMLQKVQAQIVLLFTFNYVFTLYDRFYRKILRLCRRIPANTIKKKPIQSSALILRELTPTNRPLAIAEEDGANAYPQLADENKRYLVYALSKSPEEVELTVPSIKYSCVISKQSFSALKSENYLAEKFYFDLSAHQFLLLADRLRSERRYDYQELATIEATTLQRGI